MASDLLNVGTQSVMTAQRQLNTTGHNISNANTEGYSRQSVIQGTNMPRQFGGQNYGMGVHVENVRRSWDQFAVNELNSSTTEFNRRSDTELNLEELTSLLSSQASTKIPENLNEWFDAVKTLTQNPNDLGARKVVLEKADLITRSMNNFYEVVRQQAANTNKKLDVAVKRMNQIAVEIRDVHRLMMRTPGPHNDLMDKHEKLVKELSEYTKVTVTKRENNEGFNVHIGNGHTLVSGTEASKLTMVHGSPDANQRQLALVEGKGVKVITEKGIDGRLSSLFRMRDELVPFVQDELGRVSTSLAYEVNKLQAHGLDMRGDVGALMFTDVNSEQMQKSRVVQDKNSEADLRVEIEDISKLQGGDYSLRYDGSDYTLIKPNGDTMALEPRSYDDKLVFDGLAIEVREPPQAGEKLIIRPVRNGAEQLQLMINDPEKIAAQSYESSATFERGEAKFTVVDAGDLKEFQVLVSPKGDQFAVLDMKGNVILKPQAYPPEGVVTVSPPAGMLKENGEPATEATSFILTAGAVADDRFAANLVRSEGDNGNLLKMQGIGTDKKLNDGSSTLIDVYHDLNTEMGLKKSTSERLTEVARLEKEAAEERIASVSGVNLDEEAANMMRFQQAYMASSRVMQAANDTFNTILQLR
jgi:flagellar hook-associated protein 1 FlgK